MVKDEAKVRRTECNGGKTQAQNLHNSNEGLNRVDYKSEKPSAGLARTTIDPDIKSRYVKVCEKHCLLVHPPLLKCADIIGKPVGWGYLFSPRTYLRIKEVTHIGPATVNVWGKHVEKEVDEVKVTEEEAARDGSAVKSDDACVPRHYWDKCAMDGELGKKIRILLVC